MRATWRERVGAPNSRQVRASDVLGETDNPEHAQGSEDCQDRPSAKSERGCEVGCKAGERDAISRCGDTEDDRNSDDPEFSYRRTSDGEKRNGGKCDHQYEKRLG